MTIYRVVSFDSLKEGQLVLAFGRHVASWDFETMGTPVYAIVPDDSLEQEVERLKSENARLQNELSEYKRDRERVLSETCFGDEKHCACVPDLRAEIARLREYLRHINGCVERYVNGIEVGEPGDKHYIYPSDRETYEQISDIVNAALTSEVE